MNVGMNVGGKIRFVARENVNFSFSGETLKTENPDLASFQVFGQN